MVRTSFPPTLRRVQNHLLNSNVIKRIFINLKKFIILLFFSFQYRFVDVSFGGRVSYDRWSPRISTSLCRSVTSRVLHGAGHNRNTISSVFRSSPFYGIYFFKLDFRTKAKIAIETYFFYHQTSSASRTVSGIWGPSPWFSAPRPLKPPLL